jgi:hypothetical protein
VLAAGYLLWQPPTSDLFAARFREWLFEQEGFVVFQTRWYAGHHVPAYSILAPPLFALLSAPVVGALSAVAATAAFGALARERLGPGGEAAAWWFAFGSASVLLSNRLTFAIGLAIALAAALALSRGRPATAALLAVLTALASPVAAAFLALAVVALMARVGNVAATFPTLVGAVAPAAALAVLFPEGGTFPFAAGAFWPGLALALLVVAVTRGTVRVGALLYVGLLVAAFAIPSPVGGNATRLGTALAAPLVVAALWPDRRRLLLALTPVLLVAQGSTAFDDVVQAERDPAARAAFHRPLLERLRTEPGPLRVEVPFTDGHAEAFFLGREVPLARGWLRQVDREVNAVLYDARLDAAAYGAWLRDTAVSHVALADAPIDPAAAREAAIVRAGHPMLREVWRGGRWRLFRVVGGRRPPRERSPTSVEVDRPGVVRVRWSPYWALPGGCVRRAPGGWTHADAAGVLVLRFDLRRARSTGRRCVGAGL